VDGAPVSALPGRRIVLPVPSLVLLVGASGSGKSSFARAHFAPTEVLSSDACRAMICDDPADQRATPAAFALLRYIARRRLAAGRLTVVDATNAAPRSRRPLLALAAAHSVPAVALILDIPPAVCVERAAARLSRPVPESVVLDQHAELRAGMPALYREGFRAIHHMRQSDVDGAVIVRLDRGAPGSPRLGACAST
jgi:protein phosphatase